MTDQYTHALKSNRRYQTARATSQREGSAYTGWRPTEHRPLTWLSLIGWMAFLAACGWGLCQW